ncbi:hypothetical protein [Streptomyces sp. NPDC001401]|uniref:hypothetical protein n=1 Tax=Streptomyces sp. NPDC001401 TaxID=3364570 RepID=UPI0036C45955
MKTAPSWRDSRSAPPWSATRSPRSTSSVAYVRVEHPVFRQHEAQIQTMLGRRLPWAASQFTELLVSRLDRRS